jgi:aspartate racemase
MSQQKNSGETQLNKNKLKVNYWQQQLEGIAPSLDFFTDRVRAIALKTNSDRQQNNKHYVFKLSPAQSIALTKIARQKQVSIAIVLLTAYQVLLYRYANQQDFVVSCIDWGGDRLQTKLDILPVRAIVDGKQEFSQLLTATRNYIVEASQHSPLDIATLAEILDRSSESIATSLFQVLFRYETNISKIKPDTQIPQSELSLNISQESQYLNCSFEYNCYLLNEETIQRIAENYQVLLESIIANPETPVDALSLISTAERERVLFEWNQTQVETAPQCVHQLFETRAKQNPEAIAIIYGEQQLTYGELNSRANQLAHYLQTLGVTPESLVGLCIERSLEMVVAVLAILKAGGAYVPLDISNPPTRLAFILEDADVSLLLTQSSLCSKLPAPIEQNICIDRDWHLIDRQPQDNLNLDSNISNLAHIVYTSGSTGKPKGVMLSHGNLSHYAQSLQKIWNITPADVYLHRGSIALIVSARQLLMPLAQGATAVIVTPEEIRNPLELFDLIKRHGVTIVDHVPSFWRNFWGILNQQPSDRRKVLLDNQVRLVAAGGEQVTPEIYRCWRETFKSEVKLANIYGQTEGTGVVTVYQFPEQINEGLKSLPVGHPISNMRVYLLDSDLQPVPIGVAAEIHISGAGVALGYLNRPELTAEKFVANPYVSGERLYKTGDLGRYLPALKDGSIQFLGRGDRQVNIQGLRIELGEIEAVLSQHELAQEVAVVVRENSLGETLAAYVVPSPVERPTVEMLRAYLQQKLPSYMIPGTFTFVDAFPLTTSGKIDRRALAGLNLDKSLSIAPRDPLEAEVVQMIQTVLNIETISIHDNFIELGGNSLLAARLVAEIENKYAQKIPISRVFQSPTSEALANVIRKNGRVSQPKTLIPIKQGHSQLILFGIHNLGYGLEFYRPLAKYLDANISLYGLSSSFSNEPDKPHSRDIIGLADYYTRDLQKVQPQGPYHLIGVSFGGVIAYEIAQRLISQGQEVKFLGLLDSYCPDGQSAHRVPPIKERAILHLNKFRAIGVKHLTGRVKWRIGSTMDNIRYNLYKIDWLRENFVDRTSRNFALTEYIHERRDHEKVNQNYSIRPYPGHISFFRASDDIDPKSEWQRLAQLGLSIYNVPGDHLEILQEPHVRVLAEKLQSQIIS